MEVIAGGVHPPEQQQRLLFERLNEILSPAGKEFRRLGGRAVPGTWGRGIRSRT